jgi:Photosynthesis system II assembly factor YCF48
MAPRDDDKAMDGLLRRSLARDAAAGNACPEPDILAAYCERSLDAEEMARHDQHFSECARCREKLAAIFRAGSVTEIPVVQEAMEAAEAAPRAMAPSPVAAYAPEKRARPGIFDWRWLAPVAAAILVVVFIYGRNASRLGKPQSSGKQVAMTKPEAVPPAGLTDTESSAQHPAVPLPAPPKPRATGKGAAQPTAPPVGRELPQMARNSAPATPLPDREVNRIGVLRSEYESRNDLKKRAEAATATSMEKQTPAELDSLSATKTDADIARAKSAPTAAPTPSATARTQAETKEAGTRPEAAGQKSLVGGMANPRKQAQGAAGATATDNLRVTSQVLQVQAAAPVIQTPDAGVQYRIPGAGVVERSSDGGATWQGQSVKSNAEILAGAAPSEKVCWLVGRGGVILLTTDGQNWKKIPSPAAVDLVGVTAADATFATVTVADGRRFSTQNGGRTWQLMK